MTDEVNYRSCLLNDGKLAYNKAIAEGKRIRPYSFSVGNAYNFIPDEDGTDVTGVKGFTGSADLIQSDIPSKDTARFIITIPEKAGGFTIGNIVLYVQTDEGVVLPFIWFVSKVPYPKEVLASAGSRLIITFQEKIINVADALNVTIQPPEFFSLASFVSEQDIPQPSQNIFQQFVIQDSITANGPVIAARRTLDNRYWGMPLPFRVDEPFFGVLSGGRAGELKEKPYLGNWLWGGRLSMSDADLPFIYGGAKLTTNPILVNWVGEKLPDNPGYYNDEGYLTGEFIWGGRLNFPQSFYICNFGGLKLTDTPETTFGGIKLPKGDSA